MAEIRRIHPVVPGSDKEVKDMVTYAYPPSGCLPTRMSTELKRHTRIYSGMEGQTRGLWEF